MRFINKIIKNSFKAIGLNVSKIASQTPNPLIYHKIDLLFDVGANIGQYTSFVRSLGYKGRIVSFEPLPDAYEQLLKKSQNDPLWTIHKRCALGAHSDEVNINISQNSYSSSLLPMLQTHALAAPESVYIGAAKTDVITLDSVFQLYRQNNEKTYLKIDTQGFESEVLNGLSENFKTVFAVQLELSTVPLYDNQDTYQHFFKFFQENGFILWSLLPEFTHQHTGQLLQFDAVFIREQT